MTNLFQRRSPHAKLNENHGDLQIAPSKHKTLRTKKWPWMKKPPSNDSYDNTLPPERSVTLPTSPLTESLEAVPEQQRLDITAHSTSEDHTESDHNNARNNESDNSYYDESERPRSTPSNHDAPEQERCDFDDNSFIPIPPIPEAIQVVVDDDNLLEDDAPMVPTDLGPNIEDRAWRIIVSPTIQRWGCGMAYGKYELFMAGGWNIETNEPLNSIEMYNFQSETWDLVQGLELAHYRAECTAIVVHDHLYVFGGVNSEGYVLSVEIFDLQQQQARMVLPMPDNCAGLSPLLWNESIYLIGMEDRSLRYNIAERTFHRMPPMNLQWRTIQDVFRPLPVIQNKEQIMIIDGNEILKFDKSTNEWEPTRSNTTGQRNVALAFWHNRRLVAAASTGWMDYTSRKGVITRRSNTQLSLICSGDRFCSANGHGKIICVRGNGDVVFLSTEEDDTFTAGSLAHINEPNPRIAENPWYNGAMRGRLQKKNMSYSCENRAIISMVVAAILFVVEMKSGILLVVQALTRLVWTSLIAFMVMKVTCFFLHQGLRQRVEDMGGSRIQRKKIRSTDRTAGLARSQHNKCDRQTSECDTSMKDVELTGGNGVTTLIDPGSSLEFARVRKGNLFINHTGQDHEAKMIANMLWVTLTLRGYSCFFDTKSLEPGVRWKREIEKNIRECDIFLCVVSKEWYFRHWCMLELNMAVESNRKIVPIHTACGHQSFPYRKEFRREFINRHIDYDKADVLPLIYKFWKNLQDVQEIQTFQTKPWERKDALIELAESIMRCIDREVQGL